MSAMHEEAFGYESRLPPYAHQRKALERSSANEEFFAYLMAMRTGKTKTLLDDFGRLYCEEKVDDLLVIAPAGVYETWLTAMDEHLGFPLAGDGLARAIFTAADGSKRSQAIMTAFMVKKAVTDRPRALLINVEALSTVERARKLAEEFVGQRRCMIVIDESTAIKNPSAKRTKFVNRVLGPKASHRRILTGLISPQSPLDVYSQFDFLKPGCLGHRTFASFRSRYAITRRMEVGGRWFDMVVGFRDEDELAERMKQFSYRVRLEDCYDMKEPTYGIRNVALTDAQKRLYKEIKEYACAELEDEAHVTATIVLTKILRLHQVLCGFVVDEFGELHEVPENRTQEVLNALEEYDGKAIIWCAYDYNVRKMSKALADAYGPGSVARFWGGNRETREEEERRFKSDPSCRFMVATASAGGRGRTWSVADLTIYHSNTSNLEHRSQSEERPKGVGKEKPVAYLDILARGTVDDKIIAALRKKWNMATVINGDNWKDWLT